MSDEREAQAATEQAQMEQQNTADYLQHVLGGINENPSPALEELRQKASDANNFKSTEEAPLREDTSLLNNGLNASGTPEKKPEEQAPKVENELVNDLNGDLEGAGPSDVILDNPLMKITQEKGDKGADNPLNGLEGLEKVNEFLSSKIEGVKSVEDVVSKYSELQTQFNEVAEFKTQYETLLNGLKSLPKDLVEAIRLAETGEDYRSYISSVPSLDFNKEAKELDTKALIKAYYGDKVTDADFEAADRDSDEYDPNVEKYINTLKEHSVEKFNRDKQSFNEKTEQYLSSRQKQEENYKSSVKNSLSSVKEFFPDVTDSYLQNVESKLLENGINSLFFDENGQLKADAAARFVRASDDGGNLITQLQRIAYDKAKTEANLDILTRSQRTSPESGGRVQKQDVNEEKVNTYIQNLVGGINQSSNY